MAAIVSIRLTSRPAMSLPAMRFNRRGTGSEQYPPKMMLALLIHGSANDLQRVPLDHRTIDVLHCSLFN